jgi:hypothetical protein
MKRTYTEQNQKELDFLAKIGDREMTPDEVKELQRIRQMARQYQWIKSHRDRLNTWLPLGYKAKLESMAEDKDLALSDFLRNMIDASFKGSTPYNAILELYNHLNLSDTIDEDLMEGKLRLDKHKGQSAWIYDDGEIIGGIYANNTWIINKDEIKASE